MQIWNSTEHCTPVSDAFLSLLTGDRFQ